MKKRRILKTALITITALIVVLVLVVLFWLGPTVKLVAEVIGSKALGTPVTVSKLSINPRKGLIHLSGFAIANPESYGQSNAVSLASLNIAVDMGSVFSETVTIHQVKINSPHFTFEQSTASDNIAEYIQNIEDFIGYDPNAPPEPKDEKKEQKKKEKEEKKKREGKPSKKVVVQSLEINDVQFRLSHTTDPHLDIVIGFDQLSVSMTNGIVQLKDLYVNNPGSLRSEDLFSLDRIHVAIAPATIYHPPLSILDVQIDNPHFFVEWAYDASTVSEFLTIVDSTRARVLEWPLPKKNPAAEPEEEIVEVVAEAEVKPPPQIHKVGISNFQFHMINSVDTNLSIRVMLESLNIGLTEGMVQFGRFSISNPRRLATPDLFSLDGIDIEFDPETLYSHTVSISDVQVRKPYVFLENTPETDTISEFMMIADTITSNLPANSAAKATVPPAEEIPSEQQTEPQTAPPVELHNLLIDEIQVKLLDSSSTNAPSEPTLLAGIGSISVKLVDGEVQIKGITIPNPAGFHATNLFHLANIDVVIDPASIFSDQVVINQILINSPKINLEQTKDTGNFSELQKSLMGFVPHAPEAPSPETEVAAEAVTTNTPVPLAEQPVILERLLVTNLVVNAILKPPVSATNKPATGPKGKVGLSTLNPMTHMRKSGTNDTASVETKAAKLLAFDLLSIEPLKGIVGISNLRIDNPKGFANEHLVKLQQFTLNLDPDSMVTDTLLIKEIKIEKPRVSYERQIKTDNIKMFQETIEGAFARREEVMDKAEEELDVKAGEGQKVIVEHLLVKDGIVKAKISALPTAPIPLPDIEMKDIGKEEGGATLGEASSKIFTAFYDAIIGVVANTTGIAGDALKGAGAFTFDTLGNLTGGVGDLVGFEGKEQTEKPEKSEKKKRKSLFRGRTHK